MKVGMLTSTREKCGIARYSNDLCQSLASLVDLDVVSVRQDATPWPDYIRQSAERLNACELVHIQHEYSFWGSILPLRNRYFDQIASLRRPKVITAHTLDSAHAMLAAGTMSPNGLVKRAVLLWPGYRASVERLTFDVADRIIVHDRASAALLISRGVSAAKVRVIPMGVPRPNTDPGLGEAFREKYNLAGRRAVVVFGFVRAGRGYETVLSALSGLDDDVVLVVAGGPQNRSQEEYARKWLSDVKLRGFEDRVVLTGYLSDDEVAGAMQCAHIVLCPQERGTGSYTLQIALGHGKPVLSSDLPFFAELEDAIVTFQRGDSSDLRDKLASLLEDDATRIRLSSKALAYAEEHSWPRIAQRTVGVYEELLT